MPTTNAMPRVPCTASAPVNREDEALTFVSWYVARAQRKLRAGQEENDALGWAWEIIGAMLRPSR